MYQTPPSKTSLSPLRRAAAERELRVVSVEETYTPAALALLLEHHDWDLARLERECAALGIVALLTGPPR